MLAWVDGRPAQALPLLDRGLAYGDGLFETIAVRNARPRLLERHLARLEEGCRRLRLPLDPNAFEAELMAFSAALGSGVAKCIVTRGDGLRGYAPPVDTDVRRVLLGSPWPSYPAANTEDGVLLFPCSTRLAEQPLLAGLKHLNRLEQVLARAEWSDSCFAEGLMCDTAGRVVEGVFSNLFLVRDGQLLTADISRCGVAGVMRAEILDRAHSLGIPCSIRDLALDELSTADEVFLCNSLYGIWPVRGYQQHAWPIGPITRKLLAHFRPLLDA